MVVTVKKLTRFRPLAGDLSSLQTHVRSDRKRNTVVSVPLQGTYLPYIKNIVFYKIGEQKSFRPLAGDLSSLQTHVRSDRKRNTVVSVPLQGTYLPYQIRKALARVNGFPSPCRGLIFLTNRLPVNNFFIFLFPSPCRGLIFLTREKVIYQREP